MSQSDLRVHYIYMDNSITLKSYILTGLNNNEFRGFFLEVFWPECTPLATFSLPVSLFLSAETCINIAHNIDFVEWGFDIAELYPDDGKS